MSDVWLAHDAVRNQDVALKRARGPAQSEALEREAQILSRFGHAHVVRLLDVPETRPYGWIALEYLSGGQVANARFASHAELLRALLPVVDAVRALHATHHAHLDLKPSNLLLDGDGRIRLTDFGLACELGTQLGGGSRGNTSPERRAGAPVSIADDVYAFGALLYELLGGTPPLDRSTASNPSAEHAPESLHALAPELPAELARAVDSMLSAERPRDFDQVRRLLEPWAASSQAAGESLAEPLTIRPVTFTPSAGGAQAHAPSPTAHEPTQNQPSAAASHELPVKVFTPAPSARSALPERRSSSRSLVLALSACVALALALVFLVPLWLSPDSTSADSTSPGAGADSGALSAENALENGPSATPEATPSSTATSSAATGMPAPPATSPVAPPLSPEQQAENKRNAQTELGRWASLQKELAERDAAYWGAREWSQAEEAGAEGDTFYQARDYAAAAERYRSAQARLIELGKREPEIFREALQSGARALESAERDTALRQFEVALRIDPGSEQAKRGRERALVLDETLDRLRAGLEAERSGELEVAQQAFRAALEQDAESKPAREGLARVDRVLTQRRFDSLVSQGYRELDAGDLDAARRDFQAAVKLDPKAQAPREGLEQLRARSELNQLRSLQAKAEAAETDERFADAISAYESVLAIDASLVFAKQGLERSQRRKDLADKIDAAIGAPGRLFSREVRDEARGWIADVERLKPTPTGLLARSKRLTQLIALASQPVRVVFESDNQTRVVLLRIGPLGTFERRETELEPGRYTVIGIREGYRDVRESFLVTPGKPVQVDVRAKEAI